jgi:hypothetical protein
MKILIPKSSKFTNVFLALLLASSIACTKEKEENKKDTKDEILIPNYTRFEIENDTNFVLYQNNIINKPLGEISGIVCGIKNNNWVYVHEDSGNDNEIYVYSKSGKYQGYINLFGIKNNDWEDIAIGPGPIDGESYIYVADFGDNNAVRRNINIIRFIEPDLTKLDSNFIYQVYDYAIIEFEYPDGPRDAEELMINPINKDLIIVSKREANCHVYSLPYPQNTQKKITAIFHGKLPFKRIIAGDINQNGTQILLKDEGSIYLWNIENNPVETLFKHKPKKVNYAAEVQGEAVGWENDGKGYFHITETDNGRAKPILYHYRLQ